MAGLNYGNSYKRKISLKERNKEGAHYIESMGKWVARRLTKRGQGSTIPGKYNTKEEAEEALQQYYNTN